MRERERAAVAACCTSDIVTVGRRGGAGLWQREVQARERTTSVRARVSKSTSPSAWLWLGVTVTVLCVPMRGRVLL